jgi:m7GpppX diphosphatase
MSHPAAPASLEDLSKYSFERLLNEDPITHSLILLGSLPDPELQGGRVNAIIKIEKTALNPEQAQDFFAHDGLVKKVAVEGSTDIVCSFP